MIDLLSHLINGSSHASPTGNSFMKKLADWWLQYNSPEVGRRWQITPPVKNGDVVDMMEGHKDIPRYIVWGRQDLQTIDPETHPYRGQSSQCPHSPALLYLLQACVTASSELNNHDSHVWFYVFSTIEMLCHGTFFSPPMCDIISKTVDSHMSGWPVSPTGSEGYLQQPCWWHLMSPPYTPTFPRMREYKHVKSSWIYNNTWYLAQLTYATFSR